MQRFAQRERHGVDVHLVLIARERVRVHHVPRVSLRRLKRVGALGAHQLRVPVHLGGESLEALALVLRAHERDVELADEVVGDAHDGVARGVELLRRLGGRRADRRPLLLRQVGVVEPALLQKRVHRQTPPLRRARHRLEERVRLDGLGRAVAGVFNARGRTYLLLRHIELVHEQKLSQLFERRRALRLRERRLVCKHRLQVLLEPHREKFKEFRHAVHHGFADGRDDGQRAVPFA